jgi:hypothetical protein
MSGFIGQSVPGGLTFDGQSIAANDMRTLSEMFRADVELVPITYEEVEGSYRSPWWPGAYALNSGDPDGTTNPGPLLVEQMWSRTDTNTGAGSRYGVVGVTRNAFGTALAGCIVKLYRTSTDEVVSSIVSDAGGNYVVTTPYYPDQHYIVIYKAGFPDVYGTTINTLIGA